MATFPRMHVSLYVSDLTDTVNFYTAFFGQPAAKLRRGYAKYVLEEPALIISFVENPARVAATFGHLGFQVETLARMEQHLTRVRALGLLPREELGTTCCYARQDKFWVNDPDGVEWEVYYFHEDAEFNDPRYEQEYQQATSPAPCCPAPAAELPASAPMAFPLGALQPAGADDAACCR